MPSKSGLKDYKRPTRSDSGAGNRAIKLLKPICTPEAVASKGFDPNDACQLPENMSARWWESCEHEPYITRVELTRHETQFGETNEKGERPVLGKTAVVSYQERPNIVQAHQMPNITSGNEAQVFIDQGCALPQDHGIEAFCEYEECYSQKRKVHLVIPSEDGDPMDAGWYCSPRQARLVKARLTGKFLEVYNREVMAKQLAELAV